MCTLYDRFKNIKNGFLMRRINTFVDRINWLQYALVLFPDTLNIQYLLSSQMSCSLWRCSWWVRKLLFTLTSPSIPFGTHAAENTIQYSCAEEYPQRKALHWCNPSSRIQSCVVFMIGYHSSQAERFSTVVTGWAQDFDFSRLHIPWEALLTTDRIRTGHLSITLLPWLRISQNISMINP